mgnify:CR=1 FL=1
MPTSATTCRSARRTTARARWSSALPPAPAPVATAANTPRALPPDELARRVAHHGGSAVFFADTARLNEIERIVVPLYRFENADAEAQERSEGP